MVMGSDVIYYHPDCRPLARSFKLLRPGGDVSLVQSAPYFVTKDQIERDGRCDSVGGGYDLLAERLPLSPPIPFFRVVVTAATHLNGELVSALDKVAAVAYGIGDGAGIATGEVRKYR